jgi:radical SAM protein
MNSSFFTQRYADRPYLAIWETTRACDLACIHCRADAQSKRYPDELNTQQALNLIRELKQWQVPLFVMTGGDPLKRDDLMLLVETCASQGMNFALAPSATPLLTDQKLMDLKRAGVHRISISLDGATSDSHDAFRQVPGTFNRSLSIAQKIRELGIHLQINTTVSRHNQFEIEAIAQLIRPLSIDLWSVFFLVPTGRATAQQALNALETERALHQLYDILKQGWFDVKTTEAHHFRRIILQKAQLLPDQLFNNSVPHLDPWVVRASRGISDGRGFVFISHTGEVFPSGFFPLSAGNIKTEPLTSIYQTSPLFQMLRNADLLKGKCGRCDYRWICGGSRARSYALTQEIMGSDPYCAYQPETQPASSLS